VSTKKKATKKAPAKKAPAKQTAKKAPAKKAPAKQTSKKAPAKKSAKKAPAKKAPARSAAPAKTAPPAERTIPAKYKYLHDKTWLAKQREALLRERANYTSSADRLAAEAAALMADREPGDVQFDEESGEGDTIAVERDRDLALSAAARQSVADIDAALIRLDENTYGMCIAGDDIIPRERLEAIPEAAVCVMHKTLMF
jgi:RNA polymerase-binding transcription factor DksA